jgi:hypothetical protein
MGIVVVAALAANAGDVLVAASTAPGQMGQGSVARRCHIDLARIGLAVGDKLRNCRGRNRRIHYHDLGRSDDARNRCNVPNEIIIEFFVERGIDRGRRADLEKRVAIGRRLHPKTAPIIFCAGPHFRHEPETVQVRLLIKRTTIIGVRP